MEALVNQMIYSEDEEVYINSNSDGEVQPPTKEMFEFEQPVQQ